MAFGANSVFAALPPTLYLKRRNLGDFYFASILAVGKVILDIQDYEKLRFIALWVLGGVMPKKPHPGWKTPP